MTIPRVAAGAVVLVLALQGCALSGGPVTMSEGGEVCVPADPGEKYVFGDFLGLGEGDSVTITDVELLDSENITVDEVYVVDSAIGSMYIDDLAQPEWDNKVAAVGATATREMSNLAIVVSRDSNERGTGGRIRVSYTSGGVPFEATGAATYVLDDSCP